MTDLSVSVVVVSRGRPAALRRCLTGLGQLYYPRFEVIVVADPQGLSAITDWSGQIKTVGFDEANISAARNLGIAQAAGDIVAFIDDDAVPEPTWLDYLAAAFASPDVSAAGGFVRGRNGISFQWKARVAQSDATTRDLPVDEQQVTIHQNAPGRAAKTEGTNMAVRRDILARMGGFDPAFRFYLDETDLNLRLGMAETRTAFVPLAQVHHGFAASARRRDDRVPLSLFEIGASHAAFLRRHGAGLDALALRDAERAAQRARLLRHMVAGRLEPRDVGRLLDGFDSGWIDGAARPMEALPEIGVAETDFLPMTVRTGRGHRVMSGRRRDRKALLQEAEQAVAAGERITLVILSHTARRHRVQFTDGGVWLQSGGQFGASNRDENSFRLWRFDDRVHQEISNLSHLRKI
ncbi:glycosyltransferase family 2 protein [Flavimaricola marinus]|uniref:Putative glycosyl transferase n=1 Tax=Flavimaricola marinus TaxID=1819565 RepID=A0A238LDS3_9RHOB|nr:glycosyltransferase [Flavimaricola marinus]SMY07106.1 putative glycosyl transferase [Flavimaricola marinus]